MAEAVQPGGRRRGSPGKDTPMSIQKSFISLSTLLVLTLGVFSAQAQPAKPIFTISATNATMTSSGSNGTGSSTFTLTSEDGYTGTIGIDCYPTNEPAGAKLPYCGGSLPPVGYTLKADAVVTGSLPFFNAAVPEPVSIPAGKSQAGPAALALAAVLLGLGFHRKAQRWLVLVLLAVGMLTGLAAINGCGGGNSVVTPGTYSYTVKAVDTNSNVVTSTFNVTVP
jgi:hypothetical protein